MDYEKILKSALQSKETPFEVASWIEERFPELAESEDERIRKDLIKVFKEYLRIHDYKEDTNFRGVNIKAAIAWLEKQGNLVKYYEDKLDRCACDNFNKGYKAALEKQGEQKLA